MLKDLLAGLSNSVRLFESVGDAHWSLATPAPGWTVKHQLVHLLYYDRVAVLAMEAPDDFVPLAARGGSAPAAFDANLFDEFLPRPASALLDEWKAGHEPLLTALRSARPDTRIPWFGPSMSVASMASARLMETWAHSQDVADAIEQSWPADSPGLEHIARLACRARPYAYAVNGRALPSDGVRVVLSRVDGTEWVFGPAGASSTITGPIHEFCLVMTRRRHVEDTTLAAAGDAAREWLAIGQAYAGPPGGGRRPGQFVSRNRPETTLDKDVKSGH